MNLRLPLAVTARCAIASFVLAIASDLATVSNSFAADQTADSKSGELFFESDVRPILKLHCFHCHGEDSVREADLDVRLVRYLSVGGENGVAVKPGDPEGSLIWQRVEAGEMPPKGKGLTDAEKATLRKWIEQGARTKRAEPESLESASQWTEEERSYWAFQPPVPVALPVVQKTELLDTPIDAFLLKALEQAGLSYNPEADRATLARRLSFDLLGLPPDPKMVEEFSQDDRPGAYAQLVDRLLASPAYGERWARHWLDTAGYADSDGYTEDDSVRPWAFRYRDYVVQSFNAAKPLDEWILEQLAGDELVSSDYSDLTPADIDRLAATGFLRMAPDGTGGRGAEADVAKNDVIAETLKIVSTSLMGLTVGCAQCHDHRYDPISQVDYFRFRAIFEPALDPTNWRSKSARLVSILKPDERKLAEQVDAKLKELDERQTAELDCIVDAIFDREVEKLPEEMRKPAVLARVTPADQRSPEQLQLMKDHPSLNVDRGSAYLYEPGRLNEFNKTWTELKDSVRARRPPEQAVACLTEVPGQIPATHVHYRGDYKQPKEKVEPGVLSVLPSPSSIPVDDEYLPTTGRRLALARHLISGTHPLTARVLVNRVWMHHFGKGLVNSPGDFGMLGERPTHPELLDWLALELVRTGWDLKQLHRVILLSRAYRQSSIKSEQLAVQDPDNRLLGRMPIRRLEAEAIRDAMIEVAGMRVSTMFGSPSPVNPDDVGQVIVGSATRDGNGIMVAQAKDDPEQYRRSLYVQVRRSMPLGMMEPFDLAGMVPNCDRRNASTVTPQALLLMNNQVTLRLAERFAQRLIREAGDDVRQQVSRAVELAFATQMAQEEIAAAVGFVNDQRAYFEELDRQKKLDEAGKQTEASKKDTKKKQPEPPPELPPAEQALALYCQALLSSNQFLYVD